MSAVSDDDLRWLLALLEAENLGEIEVREDGVRVLVRASPACSETSPQPAEDSQLTANLSANQIPVLSPIAGVFYRAVSPDTEPLADVGTRIRHGQTVALVEAMKLLNEVPSPASGVVVSILVANGESVQEDQLLMTIEKCAEQED